MEDFARNVMKDLIPIGSPLELYYGPFKHQLDKFRLLVGHSILLQKICESVKKNAFLNLEV